MASKPLPKVDNSAHNHSGNTKHARGPKVNPRLNTERANKGTVSGQNIPPHPAGFSKEVRSAPSASTKNGGAYGSGSF